MQRKTQRPIQFDITVATREALQAWIKYTALKLVCFLCASPTGSAFPLI
jgi:hypothetical protein